MSDSLFFFEIMHSMKKEILVSVCIPVFDSEKTLFRALESVAFQDFNAIEVIVVNDGSKGSDEKGQNAKKIVKFFSRKYKIKTKYIEFPENRGLLEARRAAVLAATGKYIVILDSDDFLEKSAIKKMYEAAEKKNADILQADSKIYCPVEFLERFGYENEKIQKSVSAVSKKIVIQEKYDLYGKDILSAFVKGRLCGFLWGKLICRELYIEAFSHISPIYCAFADDFLQSFFLMLFAKKYSYLEETVYSYSIGIGISSDKKITNLSDWEKICSTASVFTQIFAEIQNLDKGLINEETLEFLKKSCRFYIRNNYSQFINSVAEEIKADAWRIFCDYWGEAFAEKIKEEYAG